MVKNNNKEQQETTKKEEKAIWLKWALRGDLKEDTRFAGLRSLGSEFHSWGALTAKTRLPLNRAPLEDQRQQSDS